MLARDGAARDSNSSATPAPGKPSFLLLQASRFGPLRKEEDHLNPGAFPDTAKSKALWSILLQVFCPLQAWLSRMPSALRITSRSRRRRAAGRAAGTKAAGRMTAGAVCPQVCSSNEPLSMSVTVVCPTMILMGLNNHVTDVSGSIALSAL